MQIVSGGGRIAARPKQLGGLVRVEALLRREREQLDQGLCLAQSPSVIGDDVTAQGDRERPEEADAQHLIKNTLPNEFGKDSAVRGVLGL